MIFFFTLDARVPENKGRISFSAFETFKNFRHNGFGIEVGDLC